MRAYASDPRSREISEHVHLGPYLYLEIGTWHEPLLDKHWIAGPLPDLLRLAALVQDLTAAAEDGDIIRLREVYAPASPYDLVLDVRDATFDPAGADTDSR